MPRLFTRQLAQRLDASSAIEVREAVPGATAEPGTAWLAPGGQHMTVQSEDGCLRLGTDDQAPPENSCRPAADVLFRSAAAACGTGTLAVVLTGMGRDGLRGCEHVRERGGTVLAQDQASSVVWGMPGFVAKAGLADAIVPLQKIASELCARTEHVVGAHRRTSVGDAPKPQCLEKLPCP